MQEELLEKIEEAVISGQVAFFVISGEGKPIIGIGKIVAKGEINVIAKKHLENVYLEEITGFYPARFSIRRRCGDVNEIGWSEYEKMLSLEKERSRKIEIENAREQEILTSLEAGIPPQPELSEKETIFNNIALNASGTEYETEPQITNKIKRKYKIK